MNNQHDIEHQEREFQDLLQRVMREPMAPLANAIRELDQRLDQFEDKLEAMQLGIDTADGTVHDALKQIRSLKSLTEEMPRDMRQTLQPMVAQLQTTLEQGAFNAHRDTVEQLSGQLAQQSESGKQSALALLDATRDGTAQLNPLIQSVATLQTTAAEQQQQLNLVSQQHNAWAEKFSEEVKRSTQLLRNGLIAAVVVAGGGFAGVLALLIGKF